MIDIHDVDRHQQHGTVRERVVDVDEQIDIREVVIAALTNVMGVTPSSDETAGLAEQGMTSVELISLVIILEGELGIEIPDDQLNLRNFESIERIVETIAHLVSV